MEQEQACIPLNAGAHDSVLTGCHLPADGHGGRDPEREPGPSFSSASSAGHSACPHGVTLLRRTRLIGRGAVCYDTGLAFGPLAQLGERLVRNQLLAQVRTPGHSNK